MASPHLEWARESALATEASDAEKRRKRERRALMWASAAASPNQAPSTVLRYMDILDRRKAARSAELGNLRREGLVQQQHLADARDSRAWKFLDPSLASSKETADEIARVRAQLSAPEAPSGYVKNPVSPGSYMPDRSKSTQPQKPIQLGPNQGLYDPETKQWLVPRPEGGKGSDQKPPKFTDVISRDKLLNDLRSQRREHEAKAKSLRRQAEMVTPDSLLLEGAPEGMTVEMRKKDLLAQADEEQRQSDERLKGIRTVWEDWNAMSGDGGGETDTGAPAPEAPYYIARPGEGQPAEPPPMTFQDVRRPSHTRGLVQFSPEDWRETQVTDRILDAEEAGQPVEGPNFPEPIFQPAEEPAGASMMAPSHAPVGAPGMDPLDPGGWMAKRHPDIYQQMMALEPAERVRLAPMILRRLRGMGP